MRFIILSRIHAVKEKTLKKVSGNFTRNEENLLLLFKLFNAGNIHVKHFCHFDIALVC